MRDDDHDERELEGERLLPPPPADGGGGAGGFGGGGFADAFGGIFDAHSEIKNFPGVYISIKNPG